MAKKNNQPLTRKQLLEATGCTVRVIEYLNENNRLPKVPSTGTAVYSPECVKIVRDHMKKRKG